MILFRRSYLSFTIVEAVNVLLICKIKHRISRADFLFFLLLLTRFDCGPWFRDNGMKDWTTRGWKLEPLNFWIFRWFVSILLFHSFYCSVQISYSSLALQGLTTAIPPSFTKFFTGRNFLFLRIRNFSGRCQPTASNIVVYKGCALRSTQNLYSSGHECPHNPAYNSANDRII